MPAALRCACLLAFAALSLLAADNNIVIKNVRYFDGNQFQPPANIWINDGTIKEIGKTLHAPDTIPVIDATGKTLLPGFIDSHIHVYGPALQDALLFGVTTGLDMFTDPRMAAQVKRSEAEGTNLEQADLRSAGLLVTVPKGHGTEYGFVIPTMQSPEEAQAFVDARIAEGSDYIKIVYDNGSAYGRAIPTLTKPALAAVIKAAHARKKLAVVHIGTQQEAIDAIECGADGLAHLFADSEPTAAFVNLAKSHHVFVIPTLTVLDSITGAPSGAGLVKDTHLRPFIRPDNVPNLTTAFPGMPRTLKLAYAEHAVRQLHDAGVPILAGTDAPNPGTAHGVSLHRELELLVASGLTPAEALAAATSVPAKAFALNDRGRLAVTQRADLVLVQGDPEKDILATRDIVAVFKRGVAVKREPFAVISGNEKLPDLISDFEGDSIKSAFGVGLMVSTDQIAGGKSTGAMKLVADGHQSKQAMEVTGDVAPGLPYAWAGVMFLPGKVAMGAANLSSKRTLRFWVKGDGKTYRAMLFAQSRGTAPSIQTFVAPADWTEISFPIATFDGLDGHDLTGVALVGGPEPGAFRLLIDDLRILE